MDTNSVKINLSYDPKTKAHIAELKFGNVTARVNGNARYLTDDFYDGYCYLDVPKEADKIFAKHRVDKLTDSANKELMRILRKVFVNGDVSAFQEQTKNRTAKNAPRHDYKPIEVNVKNDEVVQDLFADDYFVQIAEREPKTLRSKTPKK
jgi:hypothetical protein